MVPHLMGAAVTVDVTEVRTEKEALILGTFIKNIGPDTTFDCATIRRFCTFRSIPMGIGPGQVFRERDDKSRHFGPYARPTGPDYARVFVRRFPLRTCTDEEAAKTAVSVASDASMHRTCVDACSPEVQPCGRRPCCLDGNKEL